MSRLGRLTRMTFAEVVCRSRQQASRWTDTISPAFAASGEPRRPWQVHAEVDAPTALGAFVATAPRRFFEGLDDLDGLARAAARTDHWIESMVTEADRIATGRFALLGYHDLSYGEPIDWHLDPLSGRRAPIAHWSRIDALDPAVVGDSKVVWEVNRHQWMVTLAQAGCVTGDPRYADVVVQRVEDWARANPYPVGINWASGLEAAMRLMSWCWTLMLVRHSPALTPARFLRWQTLAAAHASHIERYLSRYYSPNTHLTGEALGLVYAGVVFADAPDAARWRDVGCRILVDESSRQVEADGTHFERATCYQRYTIEIYLHLLILAERNHLQLPAHVRATAVRMTRYLMALQMPGGQMPDVGDADGGWLLPLAAREPSDCRGVFALAAVVLDEPEFAWAARGPQPELLWHFGPQGLRAFDQMRARPPVTSGSRMFAAGGQAVMRTGWHAEAHQLIVDVGPLGCPVSSGHGHADLLSVQCVAFGEPYLVDAGTYCYTPDKTMRDHFRGTRAHNTVVVDNRDQAEPAGPFSWRSRPTMTLHGWESTDSYDLVDAAHDGYARMPGGVHHRRRVIFAKPEGWVIVDDLSGEGWHDVEVRHQFSPRRVTQVDSVWIRAEGAAGRGLWLATWSSVPLAAEIREGSRAPFDGWVSTGYGTMLPAPIAICRAHAACPMRLVTVILPVASLRTEPPDVAVGRNRAGDVESLRLPDGPIVRMGDTTLFVERATEHERMTQGVAACAASSE